MNNFFKRPLEGNSETNDAKRARVGNNLDDDINLLTSPRVIAVSHVTLAPFYNNA